MWDSPALFAKGRTGTPWAGIPFPPPAIPNHCHFGQEKGACLPGRVPQAEPGSEGGELTSVRTYLLPVFSGSIS